MHVCAGNQITNYRKGWRRTSQAEYRLVHFDRMIANQALSVRRKRIVGSFAVGVVTIIVVAPRQSASGAQKIHGLFRTDGGDSGGVRVVG